MDSSSKAQQSGMNSRVRVTVRVLLLAIALLVSVGTAVGVLSIAVAGAAIAGALGGGFAVTDRKASQTATGRFSWWKRRERRTFLTSWWVLVLLVGILIRTVSVEGVGFRTALVLAVMAFPLWVIFRRPPERPWDPSRLTK